MDPGRGHYAQPAGDVRHGRDGLGSWCDAPLGHDRRLAPDGGLPADPRRDAVRQGWAVLDERARQDPRDNNGGYAKEHRP
jgi:hypothetical protein